MRGKEEATRIHCCGFMSFLEEPRKHGDCGGVSGVSAKRNELPGPDVKMASLLYLLALVYITHWTGNSDHGSWRPPLEAFFGPMFPKRSEA